MSSILYGNYFFFCPGRGGMNGLDSSLPPWGAMFLLRWIPTIKRAPSGRPVFHFRVYSVADSNFDYFRNDTFCRL